MNCARVWILLKSRHVNTSRLLINMINKNNRKTDTVLYAIHRFNGNYETQFDSVHK